MSKLQKVLRLAPNIHYFVKTNKTIEELRAEFYMLYPFASHEDFSEAYAGGMLNGDIIYWIRLQSKSWLGITLFDRDFPKHQCSNVREAFIYWLEKEYGAKPWHGFQIVDCDIDDTLISRDNDILKKYAGDKFDEIVKKSSEELRALHQKNEL